MSTTKYNFVSWHRSAAILFTTLKCLDLLFASLLLCFCIYLHLQEVDDILEFFSFFLCKKPQFSGVDTRRICCVFSSSFLKKASISDDDDKYLDLFFSSVSAFKLDCTLLLMRLLRSRYSRLIWPIYLSPLFAIVFAFPLVLHSAKCISRSAI